MTTSTEPTARDLTGARWATPRGIATFAGSRNYGIADGTGRMLSSDGVHPSTWRTMAAARTIVEYRAWRAGSVWIEPAR